MSQNASEHVRRTDLRFVPDLLVNYLKKCNQQGKDSIQPCSFFIHGVCMIIEIPGIAGMVDEVIFSGESGMDIWRSATNGFKEQLIEIVYRFGGDIIKITGDSLTCVFTAEIVSKSMGNLNSVSIHVDISASNLWTFKTPNIAINTPSSISAELVLRAMHCANTLRAVQTEKLTVHVAMSCGELCFGILGGVENRWEFVVSGPCIHDLTVCMCDAPRQEAILSRSCAMVLFETLSNSSDPFRDIAECKLGASGVTTSLCSYEFLIAPLLSDNFYIVAIHCAAPLFVPSRTSVRGVLDSQECQWKQAKLFVPVPIADELSTCDALHSLAEIRVVTTMFMKWDSYDPREKHRDLLELQTCLLYTQHILHNTGAYLRQFVVDDKGCVLIGCWGMPHFSYLDNAHRALSAAAQIKYELNKLDMMCSFGITTGDVYCGTVGSALRMEYAAIGSVVNMSARLMCKANGGILVDHATYIRLPLSARDRLVVVHITAQVGGGVQPLQVYSYAASASAEHIPQVPRVPRVLRKAVEDHEISARCKDVLSAVLHRVAAPIILPPAIPVAALPSVLRWHHCWRASPASPPMTAAGWPVIIVEGKGGCAASTVLSWLHTQAVIASLPVCFVKLSCDTRHVQYGLWRKIFKQLMPREFYENATQQRDRTLSLLHKVFPQATDESTAAGLSVLQTVFGLGKFSDMSADTAAHPSSNATVRLVAQQSYESLPHSVSGRLDADFQIVLKTFAHLLQEQPTLLIVGNIERADERSLALLLALAAVPAQSAIVCSTLMLDPTFPRPYSTCNSGVTSGWVTHRASLYQCPSTTAIALDKYSIPEVDEMLRATLQLRRIAPADSQLVMDVSAGLCYNVREILQFIHEQGLPEFEAAARGCNSNKVARRGKSSGIHRAVRRPSRHMPAVTAPTDCISHLLLARFRELSAEMQLMLRSASVIGAEFSSDVLPALLTLGQQVNLADNLVYLLNQRWLYQDTDNETLYQFAHPHARQIIYELTPSSERGHQHQLVADYIEETSGEDKAQFAALCYHYQHCDTDKALQYCAQAVAVVLTNAAVIFDYGPCLDLLQSMATHCCTARKIAVLLDLASRLKSALDEWSPADAQPRAASCLASLQQRCASWFTCWHSIAATVAPVGDDCLSPPSLSRTDTTSSRKHSALWLGAQKSRTYALLAPSALENVEIMARNVLLRRTNKLQIRLAKSQDGLRSVGALVLRTGLANGPEQPASM